MTLQEQSREFGAYTAETFIEEDTDGDRLCCTVFLTRDTNFCSSLGLAEDMGVVENFSTGQERKIPTRTLNQIRAWAEKLGY